MNESHLHWTERTQGLLSLRGQIYELYALSPIIWKLADGKYVVGDVLEVRNPQHTYGTTAYPDEPSGTFVPINKPLLADWLELPRSELLEVLKGVRVLKGVSKDV